MSAPLSAEEEAQYTRYIDDILNEVNLETVTRKAIRAELENKLGGKDLTEQKAAIKQLIEARFDAFTAAPAPGKAESASPQTSPKANGHVDGDEEDEGDEDGDEIEVSVQPPRKKQRKSEDTEDSDAKLAAMLQAQENRMGRSTRGGGSKTSKPKPVKKKPRKKSSNKVKPEDDSDVDGSEGSTAKPRKAGGGFQKPFNLSAPLSELCGGEARLSRPQVVKKLWEHIKSNELQDPSDKRQICCDDMMQAVFKQARVDMFQMNKLVGSHLYPVEEE